MYKIFWSPEFGILFWKLKEGNPSSDSHHFLTEFHDKTKQEVVLALVNNIRQEVQRRRN